MAKKKITGLRGSKDKHDDAHTGASEQDQKLEQERRAGAKELSPKQSHRLGKEKENPKDGNIGKNNAGGFE